MTNVNKLHEMWISDPAYKAEFKAIKEEFEIASADIEARNLAELTQSENLIAENLTPKNAKG